MEGKPRGQDGEYRIYADDRPRLVWKNYRTGDYGTDKLYSGESADSLNRAEYILSKAVVAVSNHPYLVRKGITVPPGLKMKDGKLVVPAYDADGELQSLQFIDGEGNKRFLKDSEVQGASFRLKGVTTNDTLYLAEGLATGVSVWLALACQAEVLICFSATNLVHVAASLRGKSVIVCADNDRFTPGNPGLTKSLEAAKMAGGRVTLATFDEGQPGTDFNDVHQACGLDEVCRQLSVFYESETPGLRILTLTEFMDWPLPPREHLLYPIMPEQGLVLLYAPRGLDKTYVALGMGLAVINLRRPKDYQTEEGVRFEVHLTKARGLRGSEARPFEAQLCDDGEALSWLVKDIEDRELEAVRELLEQGLSIREVAKELDLPKSNVHRLKQKIEADEAA